MTKKKLEYPVVLITGKSARALVRAQKKAALKGELQSPLGKMRPRQQRKAMAKSLKISFRPNYNATFVKAGFKLIPTEKNGKPTQYTKLILEAK